MGKRLDVLGNKVLIEPIPMTETAGGIQLPEGVKSAQDLPRGFVRGVGSQAGPETDDAVTGKKKHVPIVEEGDVVVFTSYAGVPVQLGGKDYKIMAYTELLAIEVQY